MNKNKETVVKEYYTVKVDALVPIILTYKIYADSPEQAAELAARQKGQQQSAPPVISFAKLEKIKTKVYKLGTILLLLTKKF
jgi:hypothetical protein